MSDQLKKLYIEPTSNCNLNCTMCFRKTWLDEPFADMDAKTFDRVMDTMPEGVETIFFGGMGEPLFHKDVIPMLRRAASKAGRVELLTNGTLLTKETSAELLDAGLTKLWVSVDAFEPEGYAHIRKNSNFALIKNNIAKFNFERYKREDSAGLGIAFVAMKSNVKQLGDLAKFAFENKVGDINISNVIPTDKNSVKECLYNRIISLELYTQNTDGFYPGVSLPMMDTQIPGVREGLMGLYGSDCNIQFNGVPLLRRKKYCRFVEEGNTFVRHDGDVSPCMALLHSAVTYLEDNRRTVYHHSFGNVGTERLDDIWTSPCYTDFRRRVRNFEFSPCVHCGGCDNRDDNKNDCLGNLKPTCGACLWSEGIISCP
jgi:MoaA/NifB/PqqE/SkfB family radical SAM enzyme